MKTANDGNKPQSVNYPAECLRMTRPLTVYRHHMTSYLTPSSALIVDRDSNIKHATTPMARHCIPLFVLRRSLGQDDIPDGVTATRTQWVMYHLPVYMYACHAPWD